jgi:hypothetical protein
MQTATEYLDERSLVFNLREMRADRLTAAVMHAIHDHLCEHCNLDVRRAVAHALFDLFHDNGYDVVSDEDRRAAGLPERGPKGWTPEELRILESKRILALLGPVKHVILPRSVDG